VPLVARGRTLGAITLLQAESGRRYAIDDLRVAEELGRRAAVAVDNARLHLEIHEQASTLRGILAASVDHIYVFDRAGRLTLASAGAARLGGHAPGDMQGKTWQELGWEELAQVDARRQDVMATGRPLRCEIAL